MKCMSAEIEVYTPQCHSSLAERQTRRHITGDCTRLVAVYPTHQDESPTVRCSGKLCEIVSKERS